MIVKNATFWDGTKVARGELRNGPSDEEFDATGRLAIPAFNNAHTHLAMTLMRGTGDGLKLQDWLDRVIFPTEQRLTPELVYRGAMLGCLELIRTGSSSFTDMYYFVESVGRAVEESGIRGVLGTPITGFRTPYYRDADDALRLAERQLAGPRPARVEFCVAPHSIYLCTEDVLVRAKALARKYHVKFTMHVSETRKECVDCHRQTGKWPVEYLDRLGLLDTDTVLSHGAWLTKMEVRLLGERGCTVVHCPASNMKLASGGVMPLPELLAAGARLALGTDGASSNNSLDVMREMKIGSLLQKSHRWDATVAPAPLMLRMATAGSRDLAFVDLDDVRMLPCHDLIANLVYSGGAVTDLLVDDRFVLRAGEVTTFDEARVKREFAEAAAELLG